MLKAGWASTSSYFATSSAVKRLLPRQAVICWRLYDIETRKIMSTNRTAEHAIPVASSAMGHWGTCPPPSTSNNFIFNSLRSRSESQLSKYCVVCEISWCRCQQLAALLNSTALVTKLLVNGHPSIVSAPWHNFHLFPSLQRILVTPLYNTLSCGSPLKLVVWQTGNTNIYDRKIDKNTHKKRHENTVKSKLNQAGIETILFRFGPKILNLYTYKQKNRITFFVQFYI